MFSNGAIALVTLLGVGITYEDAFFGSGVEFASVWRMNMGIHSATKDLRL